ncbi:MAG: TonB-dependent receptor [Flavobacteriales bacterium]|nr:TonB-dependent receptor [Flavobacteriales bacterium]
MRSLLVGLFALLTAYAQAQDVLLKGIVLDSLTQEPLVGVSVVCVPGKGTSTDVEGRYAIRVPVGPVVVTYAYVGYRTRTMRLDLPEANSVTNDVRMQVSENQLDAMVVTAGKFEQRVGEVTQSLSILRPELVRNKNTQSLETVMDQVPGVVVVDNDPQIRSGSGFSYGAGSRVMMLVDDLPILSGDIGRPSWTFLPIENLEQVEVIKGASSVLYGSAALSGVINIRTAYPRAEPSTRVNVFGGMYDAPGHAPAKWWDANSPLFTGANFFHSQQFGRFDLVLGGNAFADQGFVGPERVPPDSLVADPNRLGPGGYENRVRFNVGTRWRNAKVKGLSYGLNANVMKSRSTSVFLWDDLDEGLFRPEPGTTTRTLGTQYYVDPHVTYYAPGGMRHTLKGRYYRQAFDNNNEQSNASHLLYGEYQVQQHADLWGPLVVTAGLVGQRTTSSAVLYSGDPDGDGENTATNAAAYLQLDKKLLHEKLNLSGGVRYESFSVNEEDQAVPVFRAGATYQVLRGTFLRASYGEGFRFPTIGERYINTGIGRLNIYPNPDLRPERSWNVEGGIKQGFKVGRFMGYLDAVVFQQEFKDYIEFTFGQWGDPFDVDNLLGLGFRSVNTGGARVTGYELELAGKGAVGAVELTMLAGYTHTTPVSTTPDQVYATPTFPGASWPPATFTNTSYDPSGNILKFRVQHLFRGDVQAKYKRFAPGLSVRYNSHVRNIDKAFVDLDEKPPFVLPTGVGEWMRTHTTGDWIVDARLGYDLNDAVRVAFLVNNLTNEVYSIRPLSIEAPRSFQVMLTYAP